MLARIEGLSAGLERRTADAYPRAWRKFRADVVLTEGTVRRVLLLLPIDKQKPFRVAWRRLRNEVAAKLVMTRDAEEVFALLTELGSLTTTLVTTIGSLLHFENEALLQAADQGFEEIKKLRLRQSRVLRGIGSSDLDDALSLYKSTLRILEPVDLVNTLFPSATVRDFTQAVADSDALLVAVTMVLEGDLAPRSTRSYRTLVSALRRVSLVRYAFARELASMAHFEMAAGTAIEVPELFAEGYRFKLREGTRVEVIEEAGQVTAILHALALTVVAPTKSEAMATLGERLGSLWTTLVDGGRDLTLDAEASRWRLIWSVEPVEAGEHGDIS